MKKSLIDRYIRELDPFVTVTLSVTRQRYQLHQATYVYRFDFKFCTPLHQGKCVENSGQLLLGIQLNEITVEQLNHILNSLPTLAAALNLKDRKKIVLLAQKAGRTTEELNDILRSVDSTTNIQNLMGYLTHVILNHQPAKGFKNSPKVNYTQRAINHSDFQSLEQQLLNKT